MPFSHLIPAEKSLPSRCANLLWVVVCLCGVCVGAAKNQISVEALIKQSKFAEAQRRIEQMVGQDPQDAHAFYLLGELRKKQAKWFDAEKAYRHALVLNGKLGEALEALGRLYAEEEKTADAIALYEQARESSRKQSITVELATLYMRDGQFEKSLKTIDVIPAASRPDKLLPVMVADYIGLKRDADVQKTVPEILHRAPQHPELVPQLANVFLQSGMVGDASELLKLAMKHLKPTASLLTALANVQARTGETAKAKSTLYQALAMDANNSDALWGAARLAGGRGEWKEALQFLKSLVKVKPPQPEISRNIVYAAMMLDDLQTAHDAALDLHDLEPDSLESTMVMSAVLIRASQWGEAEPALRAALKQHPDDKRLLLAMGIVDYNLGHIDEADKELRASLGQKAGDAEAHYMLGLVAKQRGDIPQAAEEMEASLSVDPKKPEALSSLGQLYLQLNEVEKARSVLERAVVVIPDNAQNHYQLAMTYRRLGKTAEAKQQMETYQKLIARHVQQPTGESASAPQ
ncbi:MAG TPA: tetratricopeptide repeat protein [Terriglobales bacterium]|nr:tetratricopeptide repeat protein [Terriglobales bacterium]